MKNRTWFVVGVLMLANTVSFVDRQVIGLLLEPIRTELLLTDLQLATAAGAAFALFYTTAGLVAGTLADRGDRRRLIIFGMSVWVISTALGGAVVGYWSLLATRAALAIGEAVLNPAAYSLIGDAVPAPMRGRAMSIYSFGVYLGSSLALLAGGALLAGLEHDSVVAWLPSGVAPWRWTFVGAALPGALVLLLMLKLREPQRTQSATTSLDGTSARTQAREFLRRHGWMQASFLSAFGISAIANYGMAIWLPSAFSRSWGWTSSEIGVTYGALLLTFGIAGMFMAGVASDWCARKRRPQALIVFASLTFAAVAAPAIYLSHAMVAESAIACVALMSLFLGAGVALLPCVLLPAAPKVLHGRLVALAMVATSLIGLGTGPSLIALAESFAPSGPHTLRFSLGVVCAVASALPALMILSFRRRYGLAWLELNPAQCPREHSAAR